jgi:hypothetical protein
MKQPDSVELGRADIAGWLSRLACRLRNDGLALVGRASLESSPGRQEYEDLAELWNSLERTASLLEAIQGRLCEGCRTLEVSECVAFGAVPEAGTRSPRKGGGSHEQEEGKGRKSGRRGKGHR